MKVEDVERIHEASLRILDEVGVRLEHDGIVERILAAGARPGRGPHDVRLSPEMVRENLDRVLAAWERAWEGLPEGGPR